MFLQVFHSISQEFLHSTLTALVIVLTLLKSIYRFDFLVD